MGKTQRGTQSATYQGTLRRTHHLTHKFRPTLCPHPAGRTRPHFHQRRQHQLRSAILRQSPRNRTRIRHHHRRRTTRRYVHRIRRLRHHRRQGIHRRSQIRRRTHGTTSRLRLLPTTQHRPIPRRGWSLCWARPRPAETRQGGRDERVRRRQSPD